ncbi:hypothetical protein D3C71_1797520 [compost metagenome]
MQALRREVHGLALPRRLEKSREHFVAGMDAQLEGIVAFVRADMDKGPCVPAPRPGRAS